MHRGEAGVSSFDSPGQNGDALWEGLGLLRRSAELHNYEGFLSDEELLEQLDRPLAENV